MYLSNLNKSGYINCLQNTFKIALHAADAGIPADSAVDVAKEAEYIILPETDLNIFLSGIPEGKQFC